MAQLPIITRVVLPLAGDRFPFSMEHVEIRVEDEGAGPFLLIHGSTEWHDSKGHIDGSFCLDSEAQINAFANECKRLLSQYKGDAE